MEETQINAAPELQPTTEQNLNLDSVSSDDFELTAPRVVQAKATFRGKKIPVTHKLDNPDLEDLEKRDAAQPYRSRDIGNEEEEVLASPVTGVDIVLYNKLIIETTGYKNNITPGQTPEERKASLKSIPSAHKRSAMKDITEVRSEVVYDTQQEEDAFEWTEDQTYRVRTELGTKRQFVFYSTVKEPSEKQMELYGGATKFVLEKSDIKPITRITVQLTPAVQLVDNLLQAFEGATFNGRPVDVSNAEQLASIHPYVKRSIITAVVKETELDMGE